MLDWKEITQRLFFIYNVETQQKLGKHLNVSQDQISKWINGKARPTWDLLAGVIEESCVDWNWLLTGKTSDLENLVFWVYGMKDDGFAEIANELVHVAIKNLDKPGYERLLEAANRLYFIHSTPEPDLPIEEMEEIHFSENVGKTKSLVYEEAMRIASYMLSKNVDSLLIIMNYDSDYQYAQNVVNQVLAAYTKKSLYNITSDAWGNKKGLIPAVIIDSVNQTEETPLAEASGDLAQKTLTAVFQTQAALSAFGQHLVSGQSAKAFPELPSLRGTVQDFESLLEGLEPPGESPGRKDRTA
ncbi:MAG: helix-turn-helix domain-containing protein [Planctomycetaceae bacterium]|nr:helix-turn-helix domain-containing protein [Planctomycetaceae bacterium]